MAAAVSSIRIIVGGIFLSHVSGLWSFAAELLVTVSTAMPEPLTDPGREQLAFVSELETLQVKLTFPLKFAKRVT
jgi:hypothetical protein